MRHQCRFRWLLLLAGAATAHGLACGQSDLFSWRGSTYGPFVIDSIGRAAFAGDVDADGYADVVFAKDDSASGWRSPRIVVKSGRDGTTLFEMPSVSAQCVAAGDVNGDGFADLLLRDIPGTTWNASVISGVDQRVMLRIPIPGTRQNSGHVSRAGDTNADGFDDIIVSNGQGTVAVYSGSDGSMLFSVPDRVVEPGTAFGYVVAGAGDLDGDGFDDVLIASPGPQGLGNCQLVSGRSGALIRVLRSAPGVDGYARSAAGAGDVDGDGFDDVIVTGQLASATPGTGQAVVYSGFDGSTLLVLSQPNTANLLGYGFGSTVAGAGDVNGDGLADLVVGAPGSYGGVVVFSGADGSIVHEESPLGYVMACSVDGGHDVDGDGFADIVFSTSFDPIRAGHVRVFDVGATGTPGRERFRGAACGSGAGSPRIGYRGSADLGCLLRIGLRGARVSTGAVLHLGPPISWPLGFFGLPPGCVLLAEPVFVAGTGTTAVGLAELGFPIPLDLAPIGFEFGCQWAIWDPGANSLGVSFSDSLLLTIGVRI